MSPPPPAPLADLGKQAPSWMDIGPDGEEVGREGMKVASVSSACGTGADWFQVAGDGEQEPEGGGVGEVGGGPRGTPSLERQQP